MPFSDALRSAIQSHMNDARIAARRAKTAVERRAHCEVEYRLSLWLEELLEPEPATAEQPEAEPAPGP